MRQRKTTITTALPPGTWFCRSAQNGSAEYGPAYNCVITVFTWPQQVVEGQEPTAHFD